MSTNHAGLGGYRTLDPKSRGMLAEFSRVALNVPKRTPSGKNLPAGSVGTIVDVLKGGQAYMVEFAKPFQALVTARRSEVEPDIAR